MKNTTYCELLDVAIDRFLSSLEAQGIDVAANRAAVTRYVVELASASIDRWMTVRDLVESSVN